MDQSLKFIAQRHPLSDSIALYVKLRRDRDGERMPSAFAHPPVFTPVAEGVDPGPMLSVPMDAAQQLMDQLWHCGLRPTEGSGSAGALAATQRHLEDFRHLVFKTKPTNV